MKYTAIIVALLLVRCYQADPQTALPMAGIFLSALGVAGLFTRFSA